MSTKIRFAIIGTNFITDWFLEAAEKEERFELTAVYSRTEERAKEYAKKYNAKYIFTNLEEMAASNCFDAVYIASPNKFHYEQALLFMHHKKHVLCEKAFATNAKEALHMIETAKEHHVVLMEAMKLTCLPSFLEVKKQLYKIGAVRKFVMVHCQYSSRYDAFKRGEILNAFKPELSNGALMDIGVYTIAPIVHLFGKPDSIKANAYMLHSGVDGEGTVLLNYGEIEGTCIYSKISNTYISSEIQGEKGSIVINQLKNFNNVSIHFNDGTVEDITIPNETDDMIYELDYFIRAIERDSVEAEINTHDQSLYTMQIMTEVRKQIGLVYNADEN